MQTNISPQYKDTPLGKLANQVLRNCVHCGFCNATCPTYQLLGDELDGPRGRIYLIKQVMEGKTPSYKTRQHLDRCLTCLNCETTCPSGVQYHHLLAIGQKVVSEQVKLPLHKRILRQVILNTMPYPNRFYGLVKLGQAFKPLMPKFLSAQLPDNSKSEIVSAKPQQRKMLLLAGCVQKALAPEIHQQSISLLEKLDIEVQLEQKQNCCGALTHHLQENDKTLLFVKQNLDKWSELLGSGIEKIISNASGCGLMVKDYPHYIETTLGKDSPYYKKALKVSEHTKDIGEIVLDEDYLSLTINPNYKTIAYHPPCTLQHGQKLPELVESMLAKIIEKNTLDVKLVSVKDKHLCCGSAGTYSLMNPGLSHQLRENKLNNLKSNEVDVIATANIGCLHHLQSGTETQVMHWIQLLA
ncbi:MAG: glycolate oxidase subunit GlcF [Gammaproteobacteria bacterium]|nr:glycolate oxidase subunit GlcF [Gammaproteobacteria bacterium]